MKSEQIPDTRALLAASVLTVQLHQTAKNSSLASQDQLESSRRGMPQRASCIQAMTAGSTADLAKRMSRVLGASSLKCFRPLSTRSRPSAAYFEQNYTDQKGGKRDLLTDIDRGHSPPVRFGDVATPQRLA